MDKPSELFDREQEWQDLAAFVGRARTGLAIVRGRRRHGKSALLRALADATGGLYHQAIRGVPAEQRRDFAATYQAHHGGPLPAFETWHDAVEALLSPPVGGGRSLVIIDELPYLTDAAPELESVLQRALDSRASAATGPSLVLCGSATAVMTRLLVGSAPLRGRAQLELDVRPFEFRQAAAFAGLPPLVAFPVHAAIGGVPGYATDLIDRTFPTGPEDVERWLAEVVASVRRPLVHEARSLVELDPGVREPGIYQSVLGAIAAGATRTGEIAGLLGRPADGVAHTLSTLSTLGLLRRTEDALRRGRPSWEIADPLLRLNAALLRPRWSMVERGDGAMLRRALVEPWRAQILGPHLESLAREWAQTWAAEATLGGTALRVGHGTLADRRAKVTHEVDVVVHGPGDNVIAIGEVKLRRMGAGDHERLARIAALLPGDAPVRLLLISATGFDDDLRGGEAELVDLARLYHGS